MLIAELGDVASFVKLRNKIIEEKQSLVDDELYEWQSRFKRYNFAWLAAAIRYNCDGVVNIISQDTSIDEALTDCIDLGAFLPVPSHRYGPYALAARYGADRVIKVLFKSKVPYKDYGGGFSYFEESAIFHTVRGGNYEVFCLLLRLKAVSSDTYNFMQENQLGERRASVSPSNPVRFIATEEQWRDAATDDSMKFDSCLKNVEFSPDSDAFAMTCLKGDYEVVAQFLPAVRRYLSSNPNDPRPIFGNYSTALMLNRAIMYASISGNVQLVKMPMKMQKEAAKSMQGLGINQGPYIPHINVLALAHFDDPYSEGDYASGGRSFPISELENWTLSQARQALEILIEQGADMKAFDRFGKSAWHYIIRKHREPGIANLARDFLINAGVSVVDQHEETALLALVRRVTKPSEETLRLLQMLITPETVNRASVHGSLPIDLAKHGAVSIKLLEAGADVNHQDRFNKPWGITWMESLTSGVTKDYLSKCFVGDSKKPDEEALQKVLEDEKQLCHERRLRDVGEAPNAQSLDERLEFAEATISHIFKGLSPENLAKAKQMLSTFVEGVTLTTMHTRESILGAYSHSKPKELAEMANEFVRVGRSQKVSRVLTQLLS